MPGLSPNMLVTCDLMRLASEDDKQETSFPKEACEITAALVILTLTLHPASSIRNNSNKKLRVCPPDSQGDPGFCKWRKELEGTPGQPQKKLQKKQ